jgi:uncharacterized protein (TIGR02391 family)
MTLNSEERDMVLLVVQRFLFPPQDSTPRKLLLQQFRNPKAIDRLVRLQFFRPFQSDNTVSYLPMILAFEYCGDREALAYAKECLGVTLRILYSLYANDFDRSQYTRSEVIEFATPLCLSPVKVDLGLRLAQEVGIFSAWGEDLKSHTMSSISMREDILTLSIKDAWDECVASYKVAEKQPSFVASAPPLDQNAGLGVRENVPAWHPSIEEASRSVFGDGHYREAVLNAYICVVHAVKTKSGIQEKDGDPLMNECFGCDGRQPPVQFNPCAGQADIDEQRGLMYLFKGIVGIRNLYAHSLERLDNKERASEHLALASLLMHLLDGATVNLPADAN